jgi:hypothetical protein
MLLTCDWRAGGVVPASSGRTYLLTLIFRRCRSATSLRGKGAVLLIANRRSEASVFKSIKQSAVVCAVALVLTAVSHEATAERVCPRVEFTLVEPGASPETRAVKLGDQTIFVRRSAITTTSDISEIKLVTDGVEARILIRFYPAAAQRMLEATTDHDGLKMAFVVDDEVLLGFTWTGPYGIGPGGTQVSLENGLARAQRLMKSIEGCTGNQPNVIETRRNSGASAPEQPE